MTDPRKDPARRCMPVEEWPEPDRQAWEAANRVGDPLDEGGLAAGWRPLTGLAVAKAYGRWLTWLSHSSGLAPRARPAERITRDRLRGYIAALLGTVAPATAYGLVRDLSQAIRVMEPDRDRSLLKLATQRLKARAKPTRNKRSKLVDPRDLAELGRTLMTEAESDTASRPDWRASRYRDGLTILLLACRPLRRENLASMRLDQHLVRAGESWRIAFDQTETKNHRPYETVLDPILTPFMDRYLDHYRPMLLRRGTSDSDRVWISWRGKPMTSCCIYDRIVSLTRKHLGRRVNPHLFRDAAVTALAEAAPEKVWLAMPLLHHADPRSAERSYNQALSQQAVRSFQEDVVQARKNAMSNGALRRHRSR